MGSFTRSSWACMEAGGGSLAALFDLRTFYGQSLPRLPRYRMCLNCRHSTPKLLGSSRNCHMYIAKSTCNCSIQLLLVGSGLPWYMYAYGHSKASERLSLFFPSGVMHSQPPHGIPQETAQPDLKAFHQYHQFDYPLTFSLSLHTIPLLPLVNSKH